MKKKTYGICMIAVFVLAGCKMQVTPEDVSRADQLQGKTSDLNIIIPEDMVLDSTLDGQYVTARFGGNISFEDTVGMFTGLPEETIKKNTTTSAWETEGYESSGEVLSFGDITYLINKDDGASTGCYFAADTPVVNIYTALVNSNRLSGTAYNAVFLRQRFPNTELTALSSQEAIAACETYIDAYGFDYYKVDVYAMDTESLLQLQEEFDIYSPDGDPWEEKDECYLLLYKNQINGVPIYDIDSESSVRILYSPVNGLLSFDSAYIYQDIIAEEAVELIAPERVLPNLSGMAATLGIEGTTMEVTGVQLGYIAKREQLIDYKREGILTPCYQITYLLTEEDGTQLEGDFVVDAVTGYQLTWN